jgi:hypothetical protein
MEQSDSEVSIGAGVELEVVKAWLFPLDMVGDGTNGLKDTIKKGMVGKFISLWGGGGMHINSFLNGRGFCMHVRAKRFRNFG